MSALWFFADWVYVSKVMKNELRGWWLLHPSLCFWKSIGLWALILIMPLLSIFYINQTLCIFFFSHTILSPRRICHILHILESIFGGNIFYLRSNKLLIYIVVIIILIIKLSKIFLDLLSISLRILIVIILLPLFEPLYCEQRLLIYVGFKETSFP